MKTINLSLLLLFVNFSFNHAQCIHKEQVAINYFFNNVFHLYYPEIAGVFFSGKVENSASTFGHMRVCFNNDSELSFKIDQESKKMELTGKIITINPSLNHISIFKKDRKSRIKLLVNQSTSFNSLYYVEIDIIKKGQFIDVFFFEIDENGTVLRWCKTGEIY